MKLSTYSCALTAFVGTLALVAAAQAQTPNDKGPYLSLGAGVNRPDPDRDVTMPGFPTTLPTLNTKLSFKTGYNIVGAFGYKWQSGLRGEVELGWRSAKIGRVNSVPWTGRQEIFGIMGNALYDFNVGETVKPYIGIGLGWARARFNNVTGFSSNTVPQAVFSGHDDGFQWQGIAGVNMAVSDRVSMFVDYRYIRLNNMDISSRSNPVSRLVDHDERSHNIMIGVKFALGKTEEPPRQAAAPPPPPPPRAAPPPAPPPAPPAPEKILAFFDFDRSNLRSDAKEIVAQAALNYKQGNKTVIRVTGHADTSGTPQYNLALSERRAQSVKAELVRLGIPAAQINVAYRGESEPLVQTGDGVKEPQNRRVEIIYD